MDNWFIVDLFFQLQNIGIKFVHDFPGSFHFAVQLRQLRQVLNVLHGLGLIFGAHFAHRAAQRVHLLHDDVPHVLQILGVVLVQEEPDVALLYLVGVRSHNARDPRVH